MSEETVADRPYPPPSANFDVSSPEGWDFTRTWLVGYRKAIAMTQRELADLMGVSQSRVSELETGRADPHVATIARWMRGLGLQVRFRAFDMETGEEVSPKGRARKEGMT